MTLVLGMSVDEQDKLARECGKVEKKASDAVEAHKQSFPMAGKVVYAVQKRLEYLKASVDESGKPKKPAIALNMSLAQYWETITRVNGKPGIKLNNHWLSCAVTFGTYVGSELITEADYDKNTAQCLELAASISTAVGGDTTHDAVNQTAEELRDRSKDSAKKLREILASVKEVKEMTAEKAAQLLKSIISAGHLVTVISEAGAEIAHLEDKEMARNAFFAMITASDMFHANVDKEGNRRFDDEILNAWSNAFAKSSAPAGGTDEESAGTEEKSPAEKAAAAA